jgi:hypothetical protein
MAQTGRGPRIACAYALPSPTDAIARVPSPVLAHAVIPSLDPTTMRADVVSRDGGASAVLNCRGDASDTAEWQDGSRLPGSVKVVARRSLPDRRQAIWTATGRALAMGEGEGAGFFAIVGLEGSRVAVFGVSPWHPAAAWDGKLRAEKLGDETVYVEPDGFINEMGGARHENVWTLRDAELRVAGAYWTQEDHHPYQQDDPTDAAGFYTFESFTATARYVGREVVLEGESTWNHRLVGDAGRWWGVGRRASWVRRFELKGDRLVETGAASRWGHSLEESP